MGISNKEALAATRGFTTRFARLPEAVGRFEQRAAGNNLAAVRRAVVALLAFLPVIAGLDALLFPGRFLPLLATRAVAAAVVAAVWLQVRRAPDLKKHFALSATVTVTAALVMIVTVHVQDAVDPAQAPSRFYAGICVIAVAAGLLFSWTLGQALRVFGVVYAAYLVPTLVLQVPDDLLAFAVHNAVLLLTLGVATAGQSFNHQLRMRESLALFDIEEANRQFERTNAQLSRLDRFRTEFFANITHELKTPLALVLSPVEAMLARPEALDGEQRESLRMAHHNGLKLMRLINDLLDLARLDDAKLRLTPAALDLRQFLDGLVAEVGPLARNKGIALSFESSGTDTQVLADAHRLERVFVNLLANAIKFTGEKGSVRVRLEASGPDLHVTVEDTGIGIPQDKLDLVFERFQQVESGSTRRFGGTGIGLALARELTELHGGRIWAESTLREGTTMHVVLPRGQAISGPAAPAGEKRPALLENRNDYRLLEIQDAVGPAQPAGAAPAPAETGKSAGVLRRILLVEDNADMRQFVSSLLKPAFEVSVASDGRKGLEMALQQVPDLVITDYMMPEMDGMKMTALLKRNPSTALVPVVMLTARDASSDRVAGREAGADEYLVKPFSPPELMAVVRGLLATRDKQSEQMVDQKLDSLEVMAARLAHEIKNPLNYVLNGATLAARSLKRLKTEAQSEQPLTPAAEAQVKAAEKMVAQVEIGAQKIGNAVELLRRFAREGQSREEQLYDVDEGIRSVVAMAAPSDGTHRDVSFEPSGGARMMCVPQEFHEIVDNLVQNAVDATSDHGRIRVSASLEGGEVRVTVEDDGPGIPQEHLDKIFSPFFTTKQPGKGMGMGLSIVQRLVSRCGGRVAVRSQVGKGTAFTVTLPSRGSSMQRPAA